jgi:glutathione synthase/RimK-type ligase-like ATP-grasp enzyme
METLVVVTQTADWPLEIPGVRVVTGREYVSGAEFSGLKKAKVFNLCRQYRYQTVGYYVSLLAEARGHKPIPTAMTMQDLRSPALVRIASDELEEPIRKGLAGLEGSRFVLDIYFGRDPLAVHDPLAAALFKLFPAPLLRATFVRNGGWELQNVAAVPTSAIPEAHRAAAFAAAQAFFARPPLRPTRPAQARFDLAILYDPSDPLGPSDPKAIERFVDAAESLGMAADVIGKDDFGSLLEYDGLFIRATTAVNHFTYRFSRRAAAEGLVVIDDPRSILRCTNKVYLAELLARNGIPTPRTLIVHRDNASRLCDEIGCPCILKKPDSSSSQGVVKADDRDALARHLGELFETSDLVIAQEFVPTPFDWRIGVLDRRPLHAARYFMAPNHWQIIKRSPISGQLRFGTTDVVPVDEAPQEGVKLALKAANLVGDGFYGVDLKQVGDHWVVIEVNDCPNVEFRIEDRVLKEEIYRRLMAVFLRRLEERTERPPGR